MSNFAPQSVSRSRFILLAVVATILLAVGIASLIPPSSALTNNGSITALGTPLTENFDTLASSGTSFTWTDNSTIPGWYTSRTSYTVGTGSSNTGALYSFGVAGVNPLTDRALGSVGSGSTGTRASSASCEARRVASVSRRCYTTRLRWLNPVRCTSSAAMTAARGSTSSCRRPASAAARIRTSCCPTMIRSA